MWLLWSAFQQQREPATTALPEVTATKTQRKNNGRAAELRGTCANELRKSFQILRWRGVIRDWAKALGHL